MADFQSQLDKYRRQKQRELLRDTLKVKFWKFLMLGTGINATGNADTKIEIKDAVHENDEQFDTVGNGRTLDDATVSMESETLSEDVANGVDAEPEYLAEGKCLKYTKWAVYTLFWLTLYMIAIELQFGIVFLMCSALAGIYLNTSTGRRRGNELSAYSVFNKNCESIDGTLKAEQFEREIRFGAGSVR